MLLTLTFVDSKRTENLKYFISQQIWLPMGFELTVTVPGGSYSTPSKNNLFIYFYSEAEESAASGCFSSVMIQKLRQHAALMIMNQMFPRSSSAQWRHKSTFLFSFSFGYLFEKKNGKISTHYESFFWTYWLGSKLIFYNRAFAMIQVRSKRSVNEF